MSRVLTYFRDYTGTFFGLAQLNTADAAATLTAGKSGHNFRGARVA